MEWLWVLGFSLGSTILSVGITFLMLSKEKKGLESDLLQWKGAMEDYYNLFQEGLEASLKPILDNNSRVMGIIGEKGRTQRAENTALEIIGDDILDQNELLLTAIESVSPRFADHLRDNPEQIITMMPRIKAIAEKLGLEIPEIGALGAGPSPLSSTSRPHPFGLRET